MVRCVWKIVLLMAIVIPLSLNAGTKPQKKMAAKEAAVTGEVVDVSCYLHSGARGEDHADCAATCAKAGGALGILTKSGKLFVSVLPDDHKSGPNALLMDHIAHTVTAKGYIRSKGGVNGIMITSVTTQ
jgi:hypothetical protein